MILPPATRHQISASRRLPTGLPTRDKYAAAARLSQYYTRAAVAKRLYAVFCSLVDPSRFLLIEPSAGTGSFYVLLPPGSRAFDIDPKLVGIEKKDFLKVEIGGSRPIAFIGNPPFSDGMAKRFFNHAALEAGVIAFILPRSFRKAAVHNKLNRDFHLLHEENVEQDAFLFCSKLVHVPAVFQVWVRRGVERELRLGPITHDDFDFVKAPGSLNALDSLKAANFADFALQRVGVHAGRVHDDLGLSGQAHYFIRANRPGVRSIMESLDFGSVTRDVAAKPSLAKTELVELYARWIDRFGYGLPDLSTRCAKSA